MTKKEKWKLRHKKMVSQIYTNGKIVDKVIPEQEDVLPNDTNKKLAIARDISKTQLTHLRERYHYQRYTTEEWQAFVKKSYAQEWTDLFQENIMSFSDTTPLVERDYWMMHKWSKLLKMDGTTPLKEWERLIEKFKIAHLYAKHMFLPHDITKMGISMCIKIKFLLNNEVLTKQLLEFDDGFINKLIDKYIKNIKHIHCNHYTKYTPWLVQQHRERYQPSDWKEVRKQKSWYGKKKI